MFASTVYVPAPVRFNNPLEENTLSRLAPVTEVRYVFVSKPNVPAAVILTSGEPELQVNPAIEVKADEAFCLEDKSTVKWDAEVPAPDSGLSATTLAK